MVSRNMFLLFRKVKSETEYMVVVEEAREDPWQTAALPKRDTDLQVQPLCGTK